jgi:hypothetical protein
MSLRFECPACNGSLKVREELEGKRIRCPKCQQIVQVPDDSEPRIEPANVPSPIAAGPKGPPPMPGDENTTPPYHGDPSFRSPIVRFVIMLFGLIALIASPITGYVTVQKILAGRASVNWPTAVGKMERSDVQERKAKIRDGAITKEVSTFYPLVQYRFHVGDRDYLGSKVGQFEVGYNTVEEAFAVANRFALNTEVKVYYSPEDPKESILEPGVQNSQYLFLLVPVLLAVAGIGCLWLARVLKKRPLKARVSE